MAVRKFGYFDFRNYAPVALKELNDGSITVGVASSDTAVGQWVTPAGSLLYAQVGAAGVAPGLTPVLTANGWNMPYAATNALGVEVSPCPNISNASSNCQFTIGTDAAFYVQCTFQCATVANVLMAGVGFRTAGAFNGTTANYTVANMYAAGATLYNDTLGVFNEAGTAFTESKTNAAVGVHTSTTQTETNATNVTYRVQVNGTAVTYYRNGVLTSAGSTATAAGTNILVPAMYMIQGAAAQSLINVQSFGWGRV